MTLAGDANPTPTGPVAVISDVHLAWRRRWRRRVNRLRPLWAGAAAVVFNGDTLDRTTSARPERAREVLDHIRQCCAADGAEAVFVGGNSDFDAVEDDHAVLAGGAVLATHGHVLLPGICPWRSTAANLRRARQQALEELPPDQRQTLAGQLHAARMGLVRGMRPFDPRRRDLVLPVLRLWSFLHRPDRALCILGVWRDTPARAAEFLRRYCPRARVILIGHTHRPGVWQVGERWVINTGSVRSAWRPLVARVEGRTVIVRRARARAGQLHPGATLAEITL
ncbi:MAG TPA: metallophosphoesterase [Phycisphaerae bacterium]|nr:metallophosphoesterase [Phycisphaerae bacterium]